LSSEYTEPDQHARFSVVARDGTSGARAGVLRTAHFAVETPVFMPVGTQGTVKGLLPDELMAMGAQVVLGNTYHLWLRPGHLLIARAGGLHTFMGWPRAILTDSGGFQILSLAHLGEVDEEGATLRSHLDDSVRTLTPEDAMEIQAALGSDIAMVLDVCPPYPCPPAQLREATQRTTRWAHRSLVSRHAPDQAVFGIVQGGTDVDLRRESAVSLAAMGFDGYGIGGLSVGEPRSETWPALDAALSALPTGSARYLMGVGEPDDVLTAVAHGVDMFDCVLPTRLGRNGSAMTPTGRLDLRRTALADRPDPLDASCDCPGCTRYSLGYVHHLVRSGEELGLRLLSLHNVRFLVRLVQEARRAIVSGTFETYRDEALALWRGPDRVAGRANRERWVRERVVRSGAPPVTSPPNQPPHPGADEGRGRP
jgi:queuine tRNA-ribosyltransferase